MIPLVASTSHSSRAASVFGGAKPIDTAAKEELEEQLQKEQEKLQHHLGEPKLERRPWERHKQAKSRKHRTVSPRLDPVQPCGGVGLGMLQPWA